MNNENKNINILDFQKAKERLKAEIKQNEKKMVVNAGLLKAGKSTLFNALAGKETFVSDVVRATVENSKIELEHYFLVDTPGLDAEDKDTKVALQGYKEADFIIFVHNTQEGELNQVEIDSIRQICEIFDNNKTFFENTIFVLTHKDQVEDSCEDILKCIQNQCETIFHHQFHGYFCVDSFGYLKGVKEQKKLLKQNSGILELLQAIEEHTSKASNLQMAQFEKKRKQLISEMEEAITSLQKMIPKQEASLLSKMKNSERQIIEISNKSIENLRDKRVVLRESLPTYRGYGSAKNYKEYTSESSAKSAGREAIADAISKVSRQLKRDALDIVDKADSYINFSRVPKEIVDSFSEAYEKMRRVAKESGITLHTNFTVTLRDPKEAKKEKSSSVYYGESALEKARQELKYVRDDAKRFDSDNFHGASYYAESYSSNLWIDRDSRENYVRGLFGNYSWKTVKVYTYDADGALDDVRSDAVEKLDDIRSSASEAICDAFGELKQDLKEQFTSLTNEVLAEISKKIKEQESEEQKYKQEKNAIEQKITQLKSDIKDVERM